MATHDEDSTVRATASSEIVVALPHVREVLELLADHQPEQVDADSRLGLARVRLTPNTEALAPFRNLIAERHEATGREVPDEPLDVLLCGLRYEAARRWSGWYPVVGKNRRADLGGEGWPYTITGEGTGGGLPTRTDALVDPYADVTSAERGAGGQGRVVGLLDTPIESARIKSLTLLTPSSELPPDDGITFRQAHGTFLAGLINQYAPEAQIHARAVLRTPDAVATSWEVAVGLMDLMEPVDGRVPDVVVLALGVATGDGEPPLVLQRAIDVVRRQCVVVAAGGNHGEQPDSGQGVGPRTPMWPAALDGVHAVGSVGTDSGAPSGFTPRVPWIDLLSPGEDVRSVFPQRTVRVPEDGGPDQLVDFDGSHAIWSGTSMAAAIAASRLVSLARAGESPHDTLARVRSAGTRYLRQVTAW